MQSDGREHGERHDIHCSISGSRSSKKKRNSLQEPAVGEEDEHPILDMVFAKTCAHAAKQENEDAGPVLEARAVRNKIYKSDCKFKCSEVRSHLCARSRPHSLVQRRNCVAVS